MNNLKEQGKKARDASHKLASLSAEKRDQALAAIARALDEKREIIIQANQNDLDRSKSEGLEAPLLKRLVFDHKKIDDVIQGINDLIEIEDPVGKVDWTKELAPGLNLSKISTPLGVLGIIFESRPDAFVQISSLALKSGNAVLLKGGREALETNKALENIIHDAGVAAGLPEGFVQNLTTREEVNEMLELDDYIDLIIPRGSNEFVRYIMDHTRIPVMGHADGICHTYIDRNADLKKAVDIAVDGKTQYPAVCNATETLLVHEDIAEDFLPKFKEALNGQVELRGDEKTQSFIDVEAAQESDWKSEYLDYILSIKVVPDIEAAIDHINTYGSGHTDAIVSEDKEALDTFASNVDSACVFKNCSTRFSDGYRFGFGAEVGISTSKLHARGPVGIDGLMSYKYVLDGNGDIVKDFADGKRSFTHRNIENAD